MVVSSMAGSDSAWALCSNATMVGRQAADAAFRAVKMVNREQVAGAIVEVGVWRGGMSCYMAMANQHSARDIWLYDTFEGLPEPSSKDDQKSKDFFKRINLPNFTYKEHVSDGKWCKATLGDVRRTMDRTGYDETMLHFVKGKVEETLAPPQALLPSEIAVLRLDTDWYESTRMELEVLWPLLSLGGWMYLDDYQTWGGAKRAVDEWLDQNNWTLQARLVGAFPGSTHWFSLRKNLRYNRARPFLKR